LLITIYLIVSGIPAIRKIGLVPFLFGKVWASTSPKRTRNTAFCYSLLTSVYGTAGAIVLGVPIGFFTAVYLAQLAPPRPQRASCRRP
ncbi:MAG: phosphate ABC transporter permease subunit PstC, partial [Oscillospiraceae bacterium]